MLNPYSGMALALSAHLFFPTLPYSAGAYRTPAGRGSLVTVRVRPGTLLYTHVGNHPLEIRTCGPWCFPRDSIPGVCAQKLSRIHHRAP